MNNDDLLYTRISEIRDNPNESLMNSELMTYAVAMEKLLKETMTHLVEDTNDPFGFADDIRKLISPKRMPEPESYRLLRDYMISEIAVRGYDISYFDFNTTTLSSFITNINDWESLIFDGHYETVQARAENYIKTHVLPTGYNMEFAKISPRRLEKLKSIVECALKDCRSREHG